MNFSPTTEQAAAVAAARTGENLVITAGAGSGKTSTLKLIADALAPQRGVYIAYNKAIANDAAKSFPANVVCRTAHSFAYRAVGHLYKNRLNGQRVTGRQAAAILEVKAYDLKDEGRALSPARVASAVMETVNKFCHSADPRVTIGHAAAVVNDIPGAEAVSHDLAAFLAKTAQRAWDTDLSRTSGRLRFTHDMYVKVWALGDPVLDADFILYDEAQDADPCVAGVVLRQKGQLIAVGDECQAVYGWRGATDAMRNWPASQRVALTKSFRFGQAVADQANVFLAQLAAPLRIEGFEKVDSKVGPVADPTAILCRTNAGVIENAMQFGTQTTYAIVGGTDAIEKFADAADSLMDGRSASWHADLGAFKTWSDVVDYVENDSGGSDLRSLVKIVTEYGIAAIRQVCANARPEARAQVVLSTAHKAKGREWDHVRIAYDFMPSEDSEREGVSRSELMLAYVAVTRAKLSLQCDALEWVQAFA